MKQIALFLSIPFCLGALGQSVPSRSYTRTMESILHLAVKGDWNRLRQISTSDAVLVTVDQDYAASKPGDDEDEFHYRVSTLPLRAMGRGS